MPEPRPNPLRYVGVIARLARNRRRRYSGADPIGQLGELLRSPRLPVWASAASVAAHLLGMGRLARRLDAVAVVASAAHSVTPTPRRAQRTGTALASAIPAICLALDILYRRRARGPAILGSLAVLGGMYLFRGSLLGTAPATRPKRRALRLLPKFKEPRRPRKTNGLHRAH